MPSSTITPSTPSQRPTEKDVVEEGSDSPVELEDSLDDPDISTEAVMSEFAHGIESDADYLAEDRRVKVHSHPSFPLRDVHRLCLPQ